MVEDWDGINQAGGFVCRNCYDSINDIAYSVIEDYMER
jgi:hypothetical protein